jgi:hypothetical protein
MAYAYFPQMLEVVKRQIQAVTLSVMAALEKEQAAQAANAAAGASQ